MRKAVPGERKGARGPKKPPPRGGGADRGRSGRGQRSEARAASEGRAESEPQQRAAVGAPREGQAAKGSG